MSRAKRREPVTLVRSPIIWKLLSGRMVSVSRPENCVNGSGDGARRGARPATAFATARMWSGVVPQQPPTMFTKPSSTNALTSPHVSAGASSYSPKAFGRPAFG